MKQRQHITPVEAQTTFVEVWKWGQELERLHAHIVPRFARPDTRLRALAYLKGIVSAVERNNPARSALDKSSQHILPQRAQAFRTHFSYRARSARVM